jgi:DnaJ-class molecular chaperone
VNVRAGEVVFKVQTIPHPVFERSGNDLKTTVKITLKQALLGFEKELTHLDGHIVKLNRLGKITKPGEMDKIIEEGMPVYEMSSERGDLLVTYEVVLPKKLT